MSTPAMTDRTAYIRPAAAEPSIPALSTRNAAEGFGRMGSMLRLAPDSVIYSEGDEASSFYKLVTGVVRSCKFLRDGRRQLDAFYFPGDLFGFECGREYLHSAQTVSRCVLVSYRHHGMEAMTGNNDGAAGKILADAMRRLQRARQHSLSVARRSAVEKLAAFLLEMSDCGLGDDVLSLPMDRHDIADYLGLTVETVSRTLARLERDQVISLISTRNLGLRN